MALLVRLRRRPCSPLDLDNLPSPSNLPCQSRDEVDAIRDRNSGRETRNEWREAWSPGELRPLPLPFPPFSENTLSWEPLAERQTRHPFIVIGCRRGRGRHHHQRHGVEPSALLLTRDAHLLSCLGLARAQKTSLLVTSSESLQKATTAAGDGIFCHPNIFEEKASPRSIITNNFCAVLVCQIGAAERQ